MQGLSYRIGSFTIELHRQLLRDGAPVPLGRKPLDLLSVLAKAEGRLVTKDELMEAVWPALVIEDNAVQAQIAALRKLLGRDAALLSTVRGYGYRLTAAPIPVPVTVPSLPAAEVAKDERARRPPPPAHSDAAGPAPRPVSRGLLAALLALLAVAGAWTLTRTPGPNAEPARDASKVGILPFAVEATGPAPRRLAEDITDRIANTLSEGQVAVLSSHSGIAADGDMAEAGRRLGADLLVDGAVRGVGDDLNVLVRLEDAEERTTIWSASFTGSAAAPQAIEMQVAAQVSDAAHWARVGRSGPVKLDAATLAAFVAGRENTIGVRSGGDGAALSDYMTVATAAPGFSWGHSAYAAGAAFLALREGGSEDAERLRGVARREARRALALDPHNGEAYLALELTLPRSDWVERERLLLEGAAIDPAFEPVILMEGRLLWTVGRQHDALSWLERAHGVDPLHGGTTWSLTVALAAAGRVTESRQLADAMHRQWPELDWTKEIDFWTALAADRDADALAELPDMSDVAARAWRSALGAALARDRLAKDRAATAVRSAFRVDEITRDTAVLLLAKVDRLDQALSIAQTLGMSSPAQVPVLFLPTTHRLRADPRFLRTAQQLGLLSYWRATGRWPDFCNDPGLPYDCRTKAAWIARSGINRSPDGSER